MSCFPARLLLSSAFTLLLAGCGATLPHIASPSPAATFNGRVHGGEQPVAGALIQLYTVGTTADGSPATPLLTATVTTDANGNFAITSLYSCSAATQVYLVASGGNPGLAAPNPNLALMTALGPCASLSPQTFIAVNELTTVAAVYALQPFFTDAAHIGSAPTDAPNLAAAFTLANQLVNPSTGTIQTTAGNAAQLNTLADILAACINTSGGTAGDTTPCGHLFTLTTSSASPAPTNTLTALLNIARNPTLNITPLYNLIPAAAPFQPSTPTPPPDLALTQTPSANTASGLHIGPPTLTFPSTPTGTTAPSQTVVISNPNYSPVTLNSITLTGLNQADFTQTNTCIATLAPFSSCTVNLTFTPGTNTTRTASLAVASATPDSPQLISLAGTGAVVPTGPHAAVDHPIVLIYPGASYDVTLSNTGTTPLAISSIALAGTPFNNQTNDCPASLDPSSSCTVSIHSIAAGADQLTILTSDAGFQSNIPILQPANAPTAVFTPSDVFFADLAVGSRSNGYTYTYNLGATVTPTISGPQASDFTATVPICPGNTYSFGPEGCTFIISFKPAAPGLRSAHLALDSSGNYIPLAGSGTSGTPNAIATLGYGAGNNGFYPYYPVPQQVALTNNTTNAISSANISIQTLTGPSEFTQTNNCGASIAPHASCVLTVIETRLSEGGTQSLLTVSAGLDRSTMLLDDSLYHVINFGDTAYSSAPAGTQDSYPLVSQASGFTHISGSIAEGMSTAFTISQCTALTGTCLAEMNFTPTQPGPQTGNVALNPNSGLRATQYIVVGTGVATEPAAKLLLSQSGFTSGLTPLLPSNGYGGSSLTLINPGPHTINLTGPALSGPDPQNFIFGQPTCYQPAAANSTYPAVAKGSQCTIPLSLANSQPGFSTATATFTDTVSGLTFSTPLYLTNLPSPTLFPASLTFTPTPTFSVSVPQSITVTRDVTHPVTSTPSGNLIAVKGACAAGETPCILTFAFAPTNITDHPAVTITDATFGTSASPTITGTAEGITVYSGQYIYPYSLTFYGQQIGTSSTRTVTLTSTGPKPLDIYSIVLSGTSAGHFTETNNCPAILAVYATCTLSVTYAPTALDYGSANLVISDSADPGEPLTIQITGQTR